MVLGGNARLPRGRPPSLRGSAIISAALRLAREVGLDNGIDWADAYRRIASEGWVRLPAALDPETCSVLLSARSAPWQEKPEEQGVVHQHGYGAFCPFDAAEDSVKAVGQGVIRGLAVAAGETAPPLFNEVTWTRYPPGAGHITAHRDPKQCGGVVAVITLAGEAPFRIVAPKASQWITSGGDVVVMSGYGWPRPDSRCPTHEAGPPKDERIVLTYRYNSFGAGAPYFYG